jgi:hypothetical protein
MPVLGFGSIREEFEVIICCCNGAGEAECIDFDSVLRLKQFSLSKYFCNLCHGVDE